MSSDLLISIAAMIIIVPVVSLFAYLPIGIFYIVWSARKADFTITKFCISLLIVISGVTSMSARTSDPGSSNSAALLILIFIVSLVFLAKSFLNLLNHTRQKFYRFIVIQGMLGVIFVEVFGGLLWIESYGSITINYPLVAIIATGAVAVNLVIHARNANFHHSAVSILQVSAATLGPLAVCWWAVFFGSWYGLMLIYFCLCIWTVQLTSCLSIIVSRNKFSRWAIFSLLVIWIIVSGIVAYNSDEPWLD